MIKGKPTKTIAVLDANKRLVGKKTVPIDADGIDFGDLRTDGTYKYDEAQKTFVPLGHGFGKVGRRQPHSNEYVMARLVETLRRLAPTDIPPEVDAWYEWYNSELRVRDEELSTRKGSR